MLIDYFSPYGDILVIIPTKGHFDYAKKCIESLNAHTYGMHCAIIDDNSPEFYEVEWPQFTGFKEHFATDGGLTRSWNRGLQIARDHGYKYAVCTNSDVLFTPGWER